jgi:predicted ABC-type sugar transport system permease subunit
MSFDETNSDDFGEAPLPEESNNNRTFMIAVGILGGIILISVACLGAVYVFSKQSRASTTQQVDAANAATGTAVAVQAIIDQSLTATFQAAVLPTTTVTLPPTVTPPVAPASPTSTPDAANPPGLAGTQVAATATVGAAYTQAALAAQFTVAPTTTALAGTGIADEYGLPGLVVMALAFVIVILFARRLRTAPGTNR